MVERFYSLILNNGETRRGVRRFNLLYGDITRLARTTSADAGTQPLPVGLIVVSKYKPGAKWRPRRLSVGQGVLDLLAHTVSARRQPGAALAALQRAAAQSLILKGVRGEASLMAASLLQHADT